MKMHKVVGICLTLLLIGCSSSDDTSNTSAIGDDTELQEEETLYCEEGVDIEESCYLSYIRLDSDEKLCCDAWLETQRAGD